MITKAIDFIIKNNLYKVDESIEIAKGKYRKGNFFKRIKRRLRWQ